MAYIGNWGATPQQTSGFGGGMAYGGTGAYGGGYNPGTSHQASPGLMGANSQQSGMGGYMKYMQEWQQAQKNGVSSLDFMNQNMQKVLDGTMKPMFAASGTGGAPLSGVPPQKIDWDKFDAMQRGLGREPNYAPYANKYAGTMNDPYNQMFRQQQRDWRNNMMGMSGG